MRLTVTFGGSSHAAGSVPLEQIACTWNWCSGSPLTIWSHHTLTPPNACGYVPSVTIVTLTPLPPAPIYLSVPAGRVKTIAVPSLVSQSERSPAYDWPNAPPSDVLPLGTVTGTDRPLGASTVSCPSRT
jgi:hypothetical protein